MPRTFHILTESEPFTRSHNGALARWVGHVLQGDKDAVVLAPAADESWQFAAERVRVVDGLRHYKTLYEAGGYLLPWTANMGLLRRILGGHLRDLQAGDTVWIHNRPEFGLALHKLVKAKGARLFLHLHNSHMVQWSERVTRGYKADCYIFNSRFLEREALMKFPELGRTAVLPGGPDFQAFYPATEPKKQEQAPVVVFSARMAREQDVHTFLDAMRLIQRQAQPVRGVVVGGTNFGVGEASTYVQELRSLAPANVSFEAFTSADTLGRLLRHADVFCMPPCWHDPVSLQMLEAMACGLPIVAMESGGMPEALAETGGVVVSPDSANGLAESLNLLLCDAGTRERMAQAAYQAYTRHFMWATVRSGYKRVLEPRGAAAQRELVPALMSA